MTAPLFKKGEVYRSAHDHDVRVLTNTVIVGEHHYFIVGYLFGGELISPLEVRMAHAIVHQDAATVLAYISGTRQDYLAVSGPGMRAELQKKGDSSP